MLNDHGDLQMKYDSNFIQTFTSVFYYFSRLFYACKNADNTISQIIKLADAKYLFANHLIQVRKYQLMIFTYFVAKSGACQPHRV